MRFWQESQNNICEYVRVYFVGDFVFRDYVVWDFNFRDFDGGPFLDNRALLENFLKGKTCIQATVHDYRIKWKLLENRTHQNSVLGTKTRFREDLEIYETISNRTVINLSKNLDIHYK